MESDTYSLLYSSRSLSSNVKPWAADAFLCSSCNCSSRFATSANSAFLLFIFVSFSRLSRSATSIAVSIVLTFFFAWVIFVSIAKISGFCASRRESQIKCTSTQAGYKKHERTFSSRSRSLFLTSFSCL